MITGRDLKIVPNISHELVKYIDDSSNVIGAETENDLKEYIQQYVYLLETYYASNKLQVNISETKVMQTKKKEDEHKNKLRIKTSKKKKSNKNYKIKKNNNKNNKKKKSKKLKRKQKMRRRQELKKSRLRKITRQCIPILENKKYGIKNNH